jgi:hypothetical protein
MEEKNGKTTDRLKAAMEEAKRTEADMAEEGAKADHHPGKGDSNEKEYHLIDSMQCFVWLCYNQSHGFRQDLNDS